MKILIVTDTYPPQINGAAQFTYQLAQGLAQHSHDVLVINPSRTWHNEEYQQQSVQVVGIASVPLYVNNTRLALPFLSHKLITQTTEKFAPDIIHAQGHFWLSRSVIEVARRKHIPTVGTNHFMPDNLTHYLHLPLSIERWLNKKLWRQCYNFFGSLDVVTTPTHKAAELFTRNGFHKPVRVISNGVDLKTYHPGHDTSALKKKYSLPDKPTALVVGRLDKEKNIDVIIRAVALAKKHIDMHLIIAGSDRGSEARHLRLLVRQLQIDDAVSFTGFVPAKDLPILYCGAHLFVMAGTAELQSIVTMEAMASGLPIIAANAVALPELVADGENGFLFKPNDYQALAKCLVYLLSNNSKRKRMGIASHQRIQRHSLDITIQRFENSYAKKLQA